MKFTSHHTPHVPNDSQWPSEHPSTFSFFFFDFRIHFFSSFLFDVFCPEIYIFISFSWVSERPARATRCAVVFMYQEVSEKGSGKITARNLQINNLILDIHSASQICTHNISRIWSLRCVDITSIPCASGIARYCSLVNNRKLSISRRKLGTASGNQTPAECCLDANEHTQETSKYPKYLRKMTTEFSSSGNS
jgi:hypothetical protein